MHNKRGRLLARGPGIPLALLTSLLSGGSLLAATPDTGIAGAHPLFVLKTDGTLSILNTETYQVVGTVTMGSTAGSTAVSPDGRWLLTADPFRNSVTILDTAAIQVTTVAVGMGPVSVVVRPDSQRAYVLNKYDSTVSVLNLETQKVVATVEVKTFPIAAVMNPKRSRLYVANQTDRSVSVIDTDANQVIATVKVGSEPQFLAITPDGKQLYVGNEDATVSVLNIDPDPDPVSAQPAVTLTIGNQIQDMRVSQDGSRLYVLTPSDVSFSPLGTVWAFSTQNHLLAGTAKVGSLPYRMLENPARSQLYVTNSQGHSVSVFDTTADKVIDTIQVGNDPQDEAISPDGKQLYVANWQDGTISVLHTEAGFAPIVAPISIGRFPTALVVKP